MRKGQSCSHLSNSVPHGKSRMPPGVTSILAAAALAPVLVTSVWVPPDSASIWIWAAIAISFLAAFAIIVLFGLLIREHRALQYALDQQVVLERKISSIAQALEDAKIQFDLLDVQVMPSSMAGIHETDETEQSCPVPPPERTKTPPERV